MKEVRSWIEKARTNLESAPNKKRPIRDQLLLREKMVADIAIQKSKLSISVEKLQVIKIYLSVFLKGFKQFTDLPTQTGILFRFKN